MNILNSDFYASTEWFCLEPQVFELLNDAYIHSSTNNIAINVDYCYKMAEALGQSGDNCITD